MPNIAAKSWVSLALACGTFALTILYLPRTKDERPSMMDVKRIAEANGFFTFASEYELVDEEAQCHRIIISRRALSEMEVDSLVMADMEHPLWRDCICIMRMRPGVGIRHAIPAPDDIVGDLLFFGDVEIIRTIKTHLASSQRPNG
jgi:hypothetical protein